MKRKLFRRKYHKPGTSPGTLSIDTKKSAGETKIILVQYSKDFYEELILCSLSEVYRYKDSAYIKWINIINPVDVEEFKKFGEHFNLHPLAMEDVFNRGQSPKLEVYDDHSFICFNRVKNENGFETEEVDIFFNKNWVITVVEEKDDPFEPIRKRIESLTSRHKKYEVDYLLYSILDFFIDEMFPVLNSFGDEIENIEEELLGNPTKSTIHKVHDLKRNLLALRRISWPGREVINQLSRNGTGYIKPSTKIYLRDCYDHIVQVIDIIETYRELTSNMMDIYLSSVSNRLNEVMKVLTIIATIFMPLSFIVGLYGMNFNPAVSPWNMPELNWYFGYPIILAILVMISGGMLVYFKKKKWF